MAQGQNLVPNPSFEDTIYCPIGLDEVSAAQNWHRPTGGSSDYFNTCSIGIASAPQNMFGFQIPRTGEAYMGIGFDFDSINYNYREYLEIELTESLKRGTIYELSFFVSCADSVTIAITKLGAVCTKASLGGSFSTVIQIKPQVVSRDNLFIIDKQNWIEIKGLFIANGDEQILTIGSFQNDNSIDTLSISGSSFFADNAYYYIDDVSLLSVSDTNIPNVFTPNDDGINDYFDFKVSCLDCNLSLQIYDRWGKLITENSTFMWDGKCNGSVCSDGVYFYLIKDNLQSGSVLSGFIHLIK